ncbi:MAG TPA: FAD-dependent monooxygenase [Xanthobacteraceae bacterium]|jgi:salicylate hydroxylase|nr:FAD-dependent monooxygenase [Xanthobacteraceae bacterium]
MARSRTIVIAGAGIGGLTLALTLAREGFRVVILEQAPQLEHIGAGIQLSPNATRILLALGLMDRLKPFVVDLQAIQIRDGRTAQNITTIPLGASAVARYGAPYWMIHRADLQAVLLSAVETNSDIVLRLGTKIEDYATHAHGITVQARANTGPFDEHGIALVGADGLWSTVHRKLGNTRPPRPARRTAWRAVLSADQIPNNLRDHTGSLWLGPDAHLVQYPVKAGAAINIVAIVRDTWNRPGWNAPGSREQLLKRFSQWAPEVRALLALPENWSKWALFDRARLRVPGQGRVTLLGDAAHPMLPFLAQGGAMAIEDAAVLAKQLGGNADIETALRSYETSRQARIARVQRAARQNGTIYHLKGPAAFARNLAIKLIGGERLRDHYDWLYEWPMSD